MAPGWRARALSAEAAFYCVSSREFFLGAVGMINSLRLLGHREPIYLLDCGLDREQRALLASEVMLVEAPPGAAPWELKTLAPLAHPAEVMVLIDADMIASRPLAALIDRAATGNIVGFENDMDRFVPEWGELLDLGPVRRQPYLSSAFVALPRSPGTEVLELIENRLARVDFQLTCWRGNSLDYPLLYADQDVLNAVLASRVESERIEALEHRLASATPFGGLEPLDLASLRCAYPDGTEPYLVHASLPAKPWLEPMYHGVYSQLLMRLLVGADLAIRVPAGELPRRFREGALARLARGLIHARDRLGWYARRLLPSRVLARLDESRRRAREAG
jgi:hypothetical protein